METRLFRNDLQGAFVSRPNRYIINVHAAGTTVEAHCPNPGRLAEILFPGTPIILERATGGGNKRRTAWTAVAAEHNGQIVPLDAHRANAAARNLVIPQLFPEAIEVSAERRFGSSRLDFVVEESDGTTYVEVKSCTLVEHGVAMFPDAPSDRATRHVNELVKASRERQIHGLVLIVITHGDPRVFVPNVHTDPVFARALREAIGSAAPGFAARAISLMCDNSGSASLVNLDVPIDMSPVDLADRDQGAYLLIAQLEKPTEIQFGANHKAKFESGYYVYVGSAIRGLSKRLARHRRKRKRHHWHIDYFLDVARLISGYPILSWRPIEHELAAEIMPLADGSIVGFGASDSPLSSHLLYFRSDPRANRSFVEVLFRHRHQDVVRKRA